MRNTLTALIFLLAGCAGPIETRVDSIGSNTVRSARYMADTDITGLAAEAQALIAKHLAAKGFRSDDPADFSLHVALSDRPADISLKGGAAAPESKFWKKRCAKREYRLGITLTKISDGTIAYKAHASEHHCKRPIAQVMPFLVAAALKDMGAPSGSYIVKRQRRVRTPAPLATSG